MYSEDVCAEMSECEPKIDAVAQKYLQDLQREQTCLAKDSIICKLLVEEAIDRIFTVGVENGRECYADLLKLKTIKLSQKVFVPAKEFPEINLTEKICKLKETFLMDLEVDSQCKILIRGRNSMSDQNREEELRRSKNPIFHHLNKELFLEITAEATPIDCYTRIAYALAEIRKFFLAEINEQNSEILPDSANTSLENIKIEEFEETAFDIETKEFLLPPPPPLVAKPHTSQNNPLDVSLADKLIKLLDETVLNPQFQYSDDDTKTVSNQIEVLSSFMVSKVSDKPPPVEVESIASLENKLISDIATTSTASSSSTKKLIKIKKKSEKSSMKTKRTLKRKISIDSTNRKSIRTKQDRKNAMKRYNYKRALFFKKQKYPGVFYMKDTETDKIVKRRITNKSRLSHCLKRSNVETIETEHQDIDDDEYQLYTVACLQENPKELVFELTPRDIIITLLDSMKMHPVLWEFHDEPYNKDYSQAIKYLCEIMSDKWLLNIDALQMRRSITRVLRFYRFSFPFDITDKFSEYFEMCALFLPSAVMKIPHARCFHCYRCFKRDRELISHLVNEHKSLQWPFKCQHCGESFSTIEEFEFHKRLPHYLEVFTCQECNKKFIDQFSYDRHYPHQKPELPRNHMCDICQKVFTSKKVLTMHKYYHGERKYKCHLCPKTYCSNSNLMLHLKRHRNELNYICDVCGNAFLLQKQLKDHMAKHTGFKITCKICNLQVRRNNFSRHLRTIHVACEGTIEDTFRAKGYRHTKGYYHHHKKGYHQKLNSNPRHTKKQPPAEKQPRQYHCKICKIPFDRLKFLKDHNKEYHFDVALKFSCKLCDSGLAQAGNLRRHYRDKHKLSEYQVFAIVTKDMEVNEALAINSEEDLRIKIEQNATRDNHQQHEIDNNLENINTKGITTESSINYLNI